MAKKNEGTKSTKKGSIGKKSVFNKKKIDDTFDFDIIEPTKPNSEVAPYAEDDYIIPLSEALGAAVDAPSMDVEEILALNNEDLYEAETQEEKDERYENMIVNSYKIYDGNYMVEARFDASEHFMKKYVKQAPTPINLLYFIAHYDAHRKFWDAPAESELVLYTLENESIIIKDTATFDMMFSSLSVFEDFCMDKGVISWAKHYSFDKFCSKFCYLDASYLRIAGNIDSTGLFVNSIVNGCIKDAEYGFAYHLKNSYFNYLHVSGRYDIDKNPDFFRLMSKGKVLMGDIFYDKLAYMHMHTRIFNEFLSVIDGGEVDFQNRRLLSFCNLTAKDISETNPADHIVDTYYKLAVLQRKENELRRDNGLETTLY